MMAISYIENGSTYTKLKRILAAQGIDSPPKTTFFYRYQKKVGGSIIELAKESMREEADKMTNDTSIACDGAYAHRRNSSQCHGEKRKKIYRNRVTNHQKPLRETEEPVVRHSTVEPRVLQLVIE